MISGTISMCIAWIFGSKICIVLTAWCREDSGKMHGRGIDKIPSRHPQTSNHSAAQILLATLKLSGKVPDLLVLRSQHVISPYYSNAITNQQDTEVELSSYPQILYTGCRELKNHKVYSLCSNVAWIITDSECGVFILSHKPDVIFTDQQGFILCKLSLAKSSIRFICIMCRN